MREIDSFDFTRHTIVASESSNGTRAAQEMIIRRTHEGELIITPIPETKRSLPLSKEEAEQWVYSVLGNRPEDESERQVKIKTLCCEDLTEAANLNEEVE
jgi:hypothetical protein